MLGSEAEATAWLKLSREAMGYEGFTWQQRSTKLGGWRGGGGKVIEDREGEELILRS